MRDGNEKAKREYAPRGNKINKAYNVATEINANIFCNTETNMF